MLSSLVWQASASTTTFLVSKTCAHPVCPHIDTHPTAYGGANARSLAKGHLAGGRKAGRTQVRDYGYRAWFLAPNPTLPPSSEFSSPTAYSGSPQCCKWLVWLLLKTTAWEAEHRGMEAGCPPCPLEPALSQGSDWASAFSAQGTPRYMSCRIC